MKRPEPSIHLVGTLTLIALVATAARAEMEVWTAPAMTRVQPESAPTGERQIAISAARLQDVIFAAASGNGASGRG